MGVAVVTLVLVALLVLRVRLRRPLASVPGRGAAKAFPDFFVEADRLAAEGRYAEAVRLLARAVAGRLSGQAVWDESGLTVREIYAQAKASDRLSPLLLPFEETVYGHRPLDELRYRGARGAARVFQESRP
jgi:hypothetical protein